MNSHAMLSMSLAQFAQRLSDRLLPVIFSQVIAIWRRSWCIAWLGSLGYIATFHVLFKYSLYTSFLMWPSCRDGLAHRLCLMTYCIKSNSLCILVCELIVRQRGGASATCRQLLSSIAVKPPHVQ